LPEKPYPQDHANRLSSASIKVLAEKYPGQRYNFQINKKIKFPPINIFPISFLKQRE
jgi:hypothetical protein